MRRAEEALDQLRSTPRDAESESPRHKTSYLTPRSGAPSGCGTHQTPRSTGNSWSLAALAASGLPSSAAGAAGAVALARTRSTAATIIPHHQPHSNEQWGMASPSTPHAPPSIAHHKPSVHPASGRHTVGVHHAYGSQAMLLSTPERQTAWHAARDGVSLSPPVPLQTPSHGPSPLSARGLGSSPQLSSPIQLVAPPQGQGAVSGFPVRSLSPGRPLSSVRSFGGSSIPSSRALLFE